MSLLAPPPVRVRHASPPPSARVADGASQLLADAALVPIPLARIRAFWAVSSDGSRVYKTAPGGCTCPAGLYSVKCKHSLAATLRCATLPPAAGGPRPGESVRLARNQAARLWYRARQCEREAARHDQRAREALVEVLRLSRSGGKLAERVAAATRVRREAESCERLAARLRALAPRYREMARASAQLAREADVTKVTPSHLVTKTTN